VREREVEVGEEEEWSSLSSSHVIFSKCGKTASPVSRWRGLQKIKKSDRADVCVHTFTQARI
jgi:hypothetical protein